MILIDTNVVVRFLTTDDMAQAMRARALVEKGTILLLLSVVLEAAWVLRSRFNLSKSAILAQLREFAALPDVTADDPPRLRLALDLAEGGMDFADAFHVAAMPEGSTLVTFDRDLVRRARALGLDAREP